MISKTLSISPRGQITLPKKLRDLFKTNTIVIEIADDKHAVISPITDVAGSISNYNKETNLPFDKIRNDAWNNSSNKKRK